MKEKLEMEISIWTIAKVVLVLLAFYLLYFIKDVLILLFVVFILVATFTPVVNKWEKKIKRLPSVLLLLLIMILLSAFLIYIVVPPVVEQFGQFINNLPEMLVKYPIFNSENTFIRQGISSLTANLSNITGGFFSVTIGLFGGIFSFFTAVILSIYMLLDQEGLRKIVGYIPIKRQEEVTEFARKLSDKIGNWFRGQIILCLIIGIIDTIGLIIIGVPYALALGVISGILELVPIVGPITSGAIAVVVALTLSPIKAIFVIALYIIVQQLEGSILVPKIMQKAVGLSPVIIITAVLVGGKLLGVAGALLAVPIAGTILVVVQEWGTIKNTFSK